MMSDKTSGSMFSKKLVQWGPLRVGFNCISHPAEISVVKYLLESKLPPEMIGMRHAQNYSGTIFDVSKHFSLLHHNFIGGLEFPQSARK